MIQEFPFSFHVCEKSIPLQHIGRQPTFQFYLLNTDNVLHSRYAWISAKLSVLAILKTKLLKLSKGFNKRQLLASTSCCKQR